MRGQINHLQSRKVVFRLEDGIEKWFNFGFAEKLSKVIDDDTGVIKAMFHVLGLLVLSSSLVNGAADVGTPKLAANKYFMIIPTGPSPVSLQFES